jgi:hypothetical protein
MATSDFPFSVSGDAIVVGDRGYGSNAGSAYVFVKPAGGWTNMTQTAELTASDGILNDELGYSVSISGTTIAAGAPQLSSGSGKAYVFVEPATGWTNMTQTAELTVPGAADGAFLGLTISVNGDVVVAGAPSEFFPGAAYLFQKPSTGWTNMTETATLLPGDTLRGQYTGFGSPVSVGGKIVAVGGRISWHTAKSGGGRDLRLCRACGRLAERDEHHGGCSVRQALLCILLRRSIHRGQRDDWLHS